VYRYVLLKTPVFPVCLSVAVPHTQQEPLCGMDRQTVSARQRHSHSSKHF